MAELLIPGAGILTNPASGKELLVPGAGVFAEGPEAAPASTATLPAGLGAMGSGKTRAIQSAGLSYMG